jgi:UDP-3-O-[3-hydroxymyristoyl] glucosamine N-acyltransferase
MIGGQAGLIDHLTIGDRVMIAAGAGIEKDVEPGVMMSGRPAKQRAIFLRTHVLVQHLPELYKQVSNLEKRLAAMEDKKSRTRKTKKSTS